MKKTVKCIAWLLLIAMILTIFMPLTTKAADTVVYDFTDAETFYKQLDEGNKKSHALFHHGYVYFATRGKAAKNPNGTRYRSIGYTITVIGDAGELQIEIKQDGSYIEHVAGDVNAAVDGYLYDMYRVSYNDIQKLCTKAYGTVANALFKEEIITIYFDTIMTVLKNGTPKGAITGGDGNKQVTTSGDIYRLVNASELKALRAIFTSHDFKAYKDIYSDVENCELTIQYASDSPSPTSSTTAIVGSGFTIGNNHVIGGYKESIRHFETTTIKNASYFGLSKPGYNLTPSYEWKDLETGEIFSAGKEYHANKLKWSITYEDSSVILTPNWQKNTYTLSYDAGGGVGTMSSDTLTFDGGYYIPKTNAFKKEGYSFNGWKLCKKLVDGRYAAVSVTSSMVKNASDVNANGIIKAGTQIKNLTTTNGETLYLVAQWTPNEYVINLDPQIPAGKTSLTAWTNKLYLLYNTKFSLTSGGGSVTNINLPTITGYTFSGYYDESINNLYIKPLETIEKTGAFYFPKGVTQFTTNKTLLGHWEPISVKLTLEANTTETGSAAVPGTQIVTATYDQPITGSMPAKAGFVFKGFFTEKDGKGTKYFNELMVNEKVSDFLIDSTLYAYWVDEIIPVATIAMESETWTNSNDNVQMGHTDDGYKIEFTATDTASGIKTMEIYRENLQTGAMDLIHTSEGHGAKTLSYTYTETVEGVIRYKVVAKDYSDNESVPVYATCYYDKTSPTIFEDTSEYDISSLASVTATIQASDAKSE